LLLGGFLPALGQPGFGGRGMGMPPMGGDVKLVKQFDKDGDGRLNSAERKEARAFLAGSTRAGGPGGLGRGGPGGFRGGTQAVTPGPKLTPTQVKSYATEPLYEPGTLRTLFLQFEDTDWEKELEDFYHTDVDVPATLTVDGKTYREAGVHFRGNTSYMMSSTGSKRPLNVSIDFAYPEQRLGGYRTLNLLPCSSDPTFVRTVLYLQIAREYGPAPKANFVRVVINGESWGVYVNLEQINADFTREWFKSTKGARWKVPASMGGGGGGLSYLGDSLASYKRAYEIKSKDEPKSWESLIKLCKALNDTPADKLEKTLAPLLDIDEALRFLAVEKVLINSDGYWSRASDYFICLDEAGRFHVVPYDVNEVMGPAEGPGAGGGLNVDPLAGASDKGKPLLSKLLAVPELRALYLGYVRDIAERWLDWNKLGPIAAQYQKLIAADVAADTRKQTSTEAFQKGLTEDTARGGFEGPGGRGGRMGRGGRVFPGGDAASGGPEGMDMPPMGGPGLAGMGAGMSLKTFASSRRSYLLNHDEIKKLSRQ
jgi:hypothetical protein